MSAGYKPDYSDALRTGEREEEPAMSKPETVLTDEFYWLCEVMEQGMHHSKLGPTYIAAKGRFKLTRDPYEAARFVDRELCHAVCVAAHSQAHLYVKSVEHGFAKLAEKASHPDEFSCPLCYDDPANIKTIDTALLEAAETYAFGCSREAKYKTPPCNKWCGRKECPTSDPVAKLADEYCRRLWQSMVGDGMDYTGSMRAQAESERGSFIAGYRAAIKAHKGEA